MNFKVNESRTKLRGGYYTDPAIASFLLRWVSVLRPARLLEPSCGDGVFFRQLDELPSLCNTEVVGFEIEPEEAAKAREAIKRRGVSATIRERDFLGWALTRLMAPAFDAVVGNPPFIRYQYLEPELQGRAEQLFAHFKLPFTKHTNAWVSFVIASLALLRPGGRLAMVVPAELLHVLHAQSLRNFLGSQCSRILLIDPEELLFSDALQGAVLLLAEKKQNVSEHTHGVAIMRTRTPSFLLEDPEEYFKGADYANGHTVTGKWMRGLLNHRQRDLLREVEQRSEVSRFLDVADVDVGIVTGANKFFLVSDAVVEEHQLQRWAHPMFGRSEHVRGVIYDTREHERNKKEGLPANFLWFKDERESDLPKSVLRYVKQGERENLHTRYKCRIRSPWYAVPSVYTTPVGMLKRSHDLPRLIFNSAEAFTTDTAYRITPKDGVRPAALVYSFVNSLTALSAELEGRHYGGGVLELVPSEIEKLLVPLVPATLKDLRSLDQLMRTRPQPIELLESRDKVVLGRAGISTADARELREAWMLLRSRRQRLESEATNAQATSSTNGEF
jgi:adenine-specific DNA-methyltransferase